MPAPKTAVGMARKLTAIVSIDVAGYSRLMGANEVATLRTLTSHRQAIDLLIEQHHGRIVGTAGDSVLAEFASVVEAVQCAVVIQTTLRAENANLPPDQRMEFRIGINLGDVMVEGEQIYGDGVNVAARVQALADPGGIFISGAVYEQIKNKLTLHYEDLGEQEVKNIAEPVRVWRVVMDEVATALAEQVVLQQAQPERVEEEPPVEAEQALPERRRVGTAHLAWAVVVGLVLIAGVVVTVRYLSRPPLSPQSSVLVTQEAPSLALPLPDKPSIMVLPLKNMSNDPEQEYFSDGLTEDLTSDLSQLSSLFVISRNTAFTYKGKAVKLPDVSRELGVRYVLEGSVRKAGEQVRITVQLVDALRDHHLWSGRYDRPLTDIFTLQDEIVRQIVANLRVEVFEAELTRVRRIPTDNLTAYDYRLRGLEHYFRFTKESNVQARQMFEKALALDPQYAEAYTFLGWTYHLEWIWRWSVDPQTLERALALAHQALTLDDSLPAAHSLLSFVYAQQQQYEQALAESERVIALDPNSADSYTMQAEVLNLAGRPEDALRVAEQAMRLNPRYPPQYLYRVGWAYYMMGRYAEAIAIMKEVISRNPNFMSAYVSLAGSYLQQWGSQLNQDPQTLEQALAATQRALALSDTYPVGHALLGGVYLGQKQYEPAITEVERAIALDPNEALSYAILAEGLSRVGRAEEALRMVEQALRRKPIVMDLHLGFIGAAYYLAGRPEEAVAPLKQFLTRYPNILGPHLTLAAVYSELGKEAEARAEAAEVLRINPNFSLEVHKQRAPIKDPAVLERTLAALRKAGLK
jgi:adenylate cyclase